MFYRFVFAAAVAAALGFTGTAAVADGEREVFKDRERVEVDRIERRAPVRRHYHRTSYRHRATRAWDGLYGPYPRRHFYVSGVHAHGYYGSPVHYATVSYRTYIYYTPTYPSLSYGYPPYAHVYSLTPGPVYNKPCLC